MKLKIRFTFISVNMLFFIVLILLYICHPKDELKYETYHIKSRPKLVESNHKDTLIENGKFVTLYELNETKNYNFRKRELFKTGKEEQTYILTQGRATVFDKNVDIQEMVEETAKEQSYYHISEKKVFVLNAKFLKTSKMLCADTPHLIILIPSIPSKRGIREAIRSTYGMVTRNNSSLLLGYGAEYLIKIAFLIGRSPNQSIEATVKDEHDSYGDIIQTDFEDSYYNLTLKILYGFKWVNSFCKSVRYVMKADDDVFVNIKLFLAELKTYRVSDKGSVFGFIHSSSKSVIVLRSGKWGVSRAEYPLQKYPPYAQGNSYTITGNLVSKIVEIAEHLPYLHIEDAFLTGVIAGKILGARLEHMLGNSHWTDKKPDPCEVVKSERISQTNMSPTLMYKTWKALLSPERVCGNTTYRARVHRHNFHRRKLH